MDTTTRTLRGAFGGRWTALVVLTFGALASCADAPTTMPTPEPTTTTNAALLPVAQTLTPGEVLGIQHALAHTAMVEASVAYGSSDPRTADLTNRIANAAITQEQEFANIAAVLGIVAVETPTSKQIFAQSAREFAYLRTLNGSALEEAYVSGFVLTGARALGVTDTLLVPNAANNEWLNAYLVRTRKEWAAQTTTAREIQKAHSDWRVNVTIPEPVAPVAPRPGGSIPKPF